MNNAVRHFAFVNAMAMSPPIAIVSHSDKRDCWQVPDRHCLKLTPLPRGCLSHTCTPCSLQVLCPPQPPPPTTPASSQSLGLQPSPPTTQARTLRRQQAPRNDDRYLVMPVAITAGDKIEGLRQWASGRCLSADRAGVYSRSEGVGERVRRVVRAE